jgi:hypothetical protein
MRAVPGAGCATSERALADRSVASKGCRVPARGYPETRLEVAVEAALIEEPDQGCRLRRVGATFQEPAPPRMSSSTSVPWRPNRSTALTGPDALSRARTCRCRAPRVAVVLVEPGVRGYSAGPEFVSWRRSLTPGVWPWRRLSAPVPLRRGATYFWARERVRRRVHVGGPAPPVS